MRISTLLSSALIVLALSGTAGCAIDVTTPGGKKSDQTQGPQTPDATVGAASDGPSDPAAPSGPDSAPLSADKTEPLKIDGFSLTQSTDCAGRDVVITGSSNTIKLTGTCGTVTLEGFSNVIAVETVDTLAIKGKSCIAYLKTVGAIQMGKGSWSATVGWVNSASGSQPDVSGTGDSSTVVQISEEDYEDAVSS